MRKIDGVTCTFGDTEAPERQGRCFYDETSNTCDNLWSKMADFKIQIDDTIYRIPPKS